MIFNYKDSVYIQKRTKKDIWQNLYEFYLLETDTPEAETTVLDNKDLKHMAGSFTVGEITSLKKHVLSHQHLFGTFYEIQLKQPLKDKTLTKVKRADLEQYGLPQLIIKYLSGT